MNFLSLIVAVVLAVCALAWPDDGEYFRRSAKWSQMGPTGGSLVSGRGGFRPGFFSRNWHAALAEPNFVKRSSVFDYYK
ncbi:unnamed protein product [Caenorhabditis auriculariae]|uniref:Uncharacterized protein n=1 Tax=Caenorhabditis auriculariae TaxID=2777116 RepID=A0A8S1HCB6_9PELO|nr:unnamed protein product [Caenorhabditis auriculariae]